MKRLNESHVRAALLLRIGLAFVFLYAAIGSLMHPFEWSGYLPNFAIKAIGVQTALHVTAVFEIVLGIWLLSGKFVKYSALVAAAMLVGIIILNVNQFLVTFRDVGLLCAALALFFINES